MKLRHIHFSNNVLNVQITQSDKSGFIYRSVVFPLGKDQCHPTMAGGITETGEPYSPFVSIVQTFV